MKLSKALGSQTPPVDRFYCAHCELVNSVLYDCVQFHGGMGYMRETPVERMSRDARVQAIGGGASEVMLEEVAKRM